MKIKNIIFAIALLASSFSAQSNFETDIINTSDGELKMTFIGHGTLMFQINDYVIHIDPVSMFADYSALPKADMILVTHHHFDHFDSKTLDLLKHSNTKLIYTKVCSESYPGGIIMNNDYTKIYDDIKIEAVPAYNIVHKRDNGEPYHPKGIGNGYILTIGEKRIYIGGDTENFPDMKNIQNIDVAFLPMNLPYTMTPQMVSEAVKMIKPKILYPYHFGETDTSEILELLKNESYCEVRIRKLK